MSAAAAPRSPCRPPPSAVIACIRGRSRAPGTIARRRPILTFPERGLEIHQGRSKMSYRAMLLAGLCLGLPGLTVKARADEKKAVMPFNGTDLKGWKVK